MTTPRLALTLLVAAAAVVPATAATTAAAAPLKPAKDPAAAPLARAAEMSQVWGRCQTARPAHRLLTIAKRTPAVRPRVKRAKAAVIKWRSVERVCSKPFNGPRVWLG
ncbi:MAG: hypothetical protein RIB67_04835 [Miltoncostaeaceae bacterium]